MDFFRYHRDRGATTSAARCGSSPGGAPDGEHWLGTVALLRAAGAEQARAVLPDDGYAEIEVHQWRFGGRS